MWLLRHRYIRDKPIEWVALPRLSRPDAHLYHLWVWRKTPFRNSDRDTKFALCENPSASQTERKNEKSVHTQLRLYFAVLRVLPQILLIFSAFCLVPCAPLSASLVLLLSVRPFSALQLCALSTVASINNKTSIRLFGFYATVSWLEQYFVLSLQDTLCARCVRPSLSLQPICSPSQPVCKWCIIFIA